MPAKEKNNDTHMVSTGALSFVLRGRIQAMLVCVNPCDSVTALGCCSQSEAEHLVLQIDHHCVLVVFCCGAMDMAPLIVHYVNQEGQQNGQSTEVLQLIPYWRAVWATQLALIALRTNITRVSPDVAGALCLDHSRVELAIQEWSRHIGIPHYVKAMRLLMRHYHARCVCRAGLIDHLETMCNNRDIAQCIASFL